MAEQCRVPLDRNKPNINICIHEKDHEGPHYTYGLGWNHIHYSGPVSGLKDSEPEQP